jgi:L-rhamnose mutarotase
MIRKAFLMSVNADQQVEYEHRHNPIWKELEDVLKAHGAHNYNIFLNPDSSQLFAYVEIESQERWDAVAQTEVCQRWWAYMKDIMPSNPDNSPISIELKQVFCLP